MILSCTPMTLRNIETTLKLCKPHSTAFNITNYWMHLSELKVALLLQIGCSLSEFLVPLSATTSYYHSITTFNHIYLILFIHSIESFNSNHFRVVDAWGLITLLSKFGGVGNFSWPPGRIIVLAIATAVLFSICVFGPVVGCLSILSEKWVLFTVWALSLFLAVLPHLVLWSSLSQIIERLVPIAHTKAFGDIFMI